ncbi:MAG: MATE family efflux transporter [Pigmentiphaga sp.]|uniref:MATE family efflux transporter n=1 Tax=Pigmentiphaga sp. TaxID=1977564 RepID=UPI0029B43893|nr:MATE family efflux transporter [Pigmentiphaga sp.]MDX3905253.1 MATE family efflux transporter [Pigmentiphaga sp.]
MALPIVLANLTQPLMSAVDTAVAGHLPGPEYLAGVALGSLLFSFLFWGFGFLRMGTTGLVAQAWGRGDEQALAASVVRALFLAAAIGILLLVLQGPLISLVLGLLGGSASATQQAMEYCAGRIWAAPLALANYVVLGWLLGCQRVRLALALQIFINLVNLAAVLLFVHVFDLGVTGIGAATAVADGAGALAGGFLLWRSHRAAWPKLRMAVLRDAAAMRRLVGINFHIFVRTACLLGSMGWFAHLGATQGDMVLAANALLLNFLTFMAFGLDGFAHAAEALVGSAVGANDDSGLRRAVRLCMGWAFGGALAYALVYLAAGPLIVNTLTDQPALRATARHFLPWLALAPIASVAAYLYDGIFIGATQTRALMQSMLLCGAAFLALSLGLLPLLGNHGLWLSFLAFNALRGLTLHLAAPRTVYRSHRAELAGG